MAGVNIQKNYISSNLSDASLANNWTVLVFGITSQGPTEPTIVQNYTTFVSLFGQAILGTPTHSYVQFLLNNNVPILFKRVIDIAGLLPAKVTINNENVDPIINLVNIMAKDTYKGDVGNNIKVNISKDDLTGVCTFQVNYNDVNVEKYNLGITNIDVTMGDLLYDFILTATTTNIFDSNYIEFNMLNLDKTQWSDTFITSVKEYELTGGVTPINNLESSLNILKDINNAFWKDSKLLNAVTYYPQLRFVTTGGLIAGDAGTQTVINQNLGTFAVNCGLSFRVLIDYPLAVIDLAQTVREFAQIISSTGNTPSSTFAYFGDWGADNSNNWLPGSAGFLSALGLANYNVYNRRIAGSLFSPGFIKPYTNLFIDILEDWQANDQIQLNPIVIIDAQDNLAIMGSSTLALPLSSISARSPAQALDVVLVGDYITAILNGIALSELEGAFDRLSLNSLSNRMTQEVERFVTSRAITRYDFNFDTTQLGKLGITCTLYFAIGLEEVDLTIASVYDTTATLVGV